MHTGKITLLGRSMAGSPAVIAHAATGRALFVASYPPDVPLSQGIVAYCQQVAEATGTGLFVIDRAVNAGALARAFDDQGWGWLGMLDDNEPQGLESCEATQVDSLEDGTRVYRGPWQRPRPDDPRHFGLVEPVAGKTWVDWATPKVEALLEVTEGPRVSRVRNEMQEHRCKRMIDPGARNTHDGRKQMIAADRHQQRAREPRGQALATAQKRVDKQAEARKVQQDQGAEAASKGHGKRLTQRQGALAVLATA